jgi:hypothetical protein
MEGVAPPPGPDARWIGLLALDQQPIAWVDEIIMPSARSVTYASIADRRRVTRIKEDTVPLVLEVRGQWFDDGMGLHFADFSAAMLNQQQAAFNLGDGTEFRMVDVLDVVGTRLMGSERDRPGMEGSPWGYVAKVLSYEPYTRERAPVLGGPQTLATGSGAIATAFTVPYVGSAPGEPSWQFTLVVPTGKHVTQVKLQNTTTGETCIVSGLNLTNGTFVLLIDASGAGSNRTPDNNGYGLLAATSPGYGASVGGTDVDFNGNPPTLREKTGQLGPVDMYNSLIATVTADGALTSAALAWLAPTRRIRQ